jgi:S-adenosylmethionine/arginine decarboxylase-like enzyme
MGYGKELILDLHNCNVGKFNRPSLRTYFKELCLLIDMQPEDCYFWDDEGVPEEEKQIAAHTKGTSAIQFILTSNITIHTLDILKSVYINIFSCKEFDGDKAAEYTKSYFQGALINKTIVERA